MLKMSFRKFNQRTFFTSSILANKTTNNINLITEDLKNITSDLNLHKKREKLINFLQEEVRQMEIDLDKLRNQSIEWQRQQQNINLVNKDIQNLKQDLSIDMKTMEKFIQFYKKEVEIIKEEPPQTTMEVKSTSNFYKK